MVNIKVKYLNKSEITSYHFDIKIFTLNKNKSDFFRKKLFL
jgi:hypothetical protein